MSRARRSSHKAPTADSLHNASLHHPRCPRSPCRSRPQNYQSHRSPLYGWQRKEGHRPPQRLMAMFPGNNVRYTRMWLQFHSCKRRQAGTQGRRTSNIIRSRRCCPERNCVHNFTTLHNEHFWCKNRKFNFKNESAPIIFFITFLTKIHHVGSQ